MGVGPRYVVEYETENVEKKLFLNTNLQLCKKVFATKSHISYISSKK